MNTWWEDIRYGLRLLGRSPAFTAIAVLTLGLGIGANTAIFSVVNWLLLRPLPVSHPSEITVIAYQQKKGPIGTQFSFPAFQDVQQQTTGVFSNVLGYAFGLDGLNVNGRADRVLTAYVTGNYFTSLGLAPAVGRLILPSEGNTAGADPYLVLGYTYWQTRFGGDPSVIGKQVSIDGHPVTIVGVAPKGFEGLYPLVDVQGYLPYGMRVVEGRKGGFMADRESRNLRLFGLLRAGTGLSQAQAVLNVVAQRISAAHPKTEDGLSLRAYPEREARPEPDPDQTMRTVSVLFLTLAALVLLLACVNVANILLVRATVREREMAVRAALGAGRARLVRQLLTESLLLALSGGVAGVLLGAWASRMLGSIHLHTDFPVRLNFSLDWRVLFYAVGAALLTGIVVGIIPALRAARCNVSEVLHEGGRTVSGGRHRLRSALVMAQVGGSLMLLIVAGLFMRSLAKAQRSNLGFDPAGIVNLSMDPSGVGYVKEQGIKIYQQLLDHARALPGVTSAALAFSVPMGYYNNGDTLEIDGYTPPPGQPAPGLIYNPVSPGYFQLMRLPIVRGRDFTDADDENAPYVAIINQAMAERFWPHENPIGREFRMQGEKDHPIRVIGIVKNARVQSLSGAIDPYFYVPLVQHYPLLATLHVRSSIAPPTVIREVEQEIQTLAPGMPFFDVQTMTDALDGLNGFLMFQIGAGLAGALGALGLILAVVGVYGVVSYSTSQRTHEIGIRMALGAQPRDVLRIIFREGLVIVGVGVAVGLAAAFAISRLVANFLVGVSATDPLTYGSVSAVLVVVALAACFVPARRAMMVEPTIALRHE
ncbi:MAG: ABC transporter permease [Acidobacteriota bacterium]|nr:ABC transporter permease [Acidobacteriota bacterium]